VKKKLDTFLILVVFVITVLNALQVINLTQIKDQGDPVFGEMRQSMKDTEDRVRFLELTTYTAPPKPKQEPETLEDILLAHTETTRQE